MKKFLFLVFAITCLYSVSNAQNMSSSYKTAIGGKGYFGDGSLGGINVKHFLKDNVALEGSILFRDRVFILEGLYEWHGNIANAAGLKWYAGPGAWIGSAADNFVFSGRGTVGLDYKFSGAPINIAFDVNPTLTFTPDTEFDFFAGIAFRFTL